MSKIIDGKALATQLRAKVAEKIEKDNYTPTLAVVMVGNNAASQVYVRNKTKACAEVGINSVQYNLVGDVNENILLDLVYKLNNDKMIDGILIQLPLPSPINEKRVIDAIAAKKDVDGFKENSPYTQCTPLGVMELIKSVGQSIAGKTALVIGRSENVGKPIARMLLEENCSVMTAHSKTPKDVLVQMFNMADIVVSAVGRQDIISVDDDVEPRENRIIIDVGINRKEDGSLCGDFSEEFKDKYADFYTPVPGGGGPMTVAMLLSNVACAKEER